ncbi:MAG: tyrosine-type recombinase/integrase [Ruminococcus flavefaciens]|nr:tyrosine-type recombinase/integrase [Ruminococcus flavefaciens]
MVSARNIDTTFRQILKNAKIDKMSGVHSLRHTFASMLFKKGVNPKTVSELLGHSDVSITIPVQNSNTKPTQYLPTANPNITMKMATPYKGMVLPFFQKLISVFDCYTVSELPCVYG